MATLHSMAAGCSDADAGGGGVLLYPSYVMPVN